MNASVNTTKCDCRDAQHRQGFQETGTSAYIGNRWVLSTKSVPCVHNHEGRFIVTESYGRGVRGGSGTDGIRIEESTKPRNLAKSTTDKIIRDMHRYANGYADHVSDVVSAGSRLITAHHWVNGFENIRQLRIKAVY